MRLRRPVRDPAWLAVVLIVGLALLVIGTLVGSRALLEAETAFIPTEAWPWTIDGVGVVPSTPDSPFRAGDVVTAIEGRPLDAWVADALAPPWLLGARGLPPTIDVVVRRDGGLVDLAAPIVAFPPTRLGGAPLGLVAFAAASILLALVLILRRPKAIVLRLILVAVACDVANIIAWETGLQPTDFVAPTPFLYAFGVASVLSLVFWAALVHGLSVYPVRAPWLVRDQRRIVLVYGLPLAGFVAGGVVAGLAGGAVLIWLDRLGRLLAMIASLEIAAVLVAVVMSYRRTPQPRRSQIRAIAVSLFLAAAATLALVSAPIALGREPILQRSAVAVIALIAVAAIAIAVARDRLFQVDLLASSRARTVAAREEERLRLRRELHDGLGPSLAALGLKVDAARSAAVGDDPRTAGPILDEVRSDIGTILADVRGLARGLRPPALDTLGLGGALRQQAEALSSDGTRVEVAAEGLPALPASVEVAAYRIVVEAVTNLVRHAGATEGSVRLMIEDDMLRIEVLDDGVGIDGPAIGVGTRAMYERASEVGGELTIEPRPGGGTRLVALLPVPGAGRSR